MLVVGITQFENAFCNLSAYSSSLGIPEILANLIKFNNATELPDGMAPS